MITKEKGNNQTMQDKNKKLKCENNVLKDEGKKLKDEINMIKDEDKKLRKKCQTLQAENKKLKDKLKKSEGTKTTLKTDPLFHSKKDLLIQGFECYFGLNKNSNKKMCGTYEKWYKDIFKKMENSRLNKYDEHLFFKANFEKTFEDVTFECGNSITNGSGPDTIKAKTKYDEPMLKNKVYVHLLNENWNGTSMKVVLILHPNKVHESIEMDSNDCKIEKSGSIIFMWRTKKVAKEFYGDNKELIFCCKRNGNLK